MLLVNDPIGGRPVAEIDVNGTRNANADRRQRGAYEHGDHHRRAGDTRWTDRASPSWATMCRTGTPDGAGTRRLDTDGLLPDLLEETEHGAIPRVAATGETPFDAYARPSLTPATAERQEADRRSW